MNNLFVRQGNLGNCKCYCTTSVYRPRMPNYYYVGRCVQLHFVAELAREQQQILASQRALYSTSS